MISFPTRVQRDYTVMGNTLLYTYVKHIDISILITHNMECALGPLLIEIAIMEITNAVS